MRIFYAAAIVCLAATATAVTYGGDSPVVIDPVEVSPDKFKIEFENAHVRVVRYQLQPGERDRWHTHPAKVSVITGGGLLRITTEEGESFEVTEETGSASWMPALGRHFAENIGSTPVEVVLVEIKSAAPPV